MTISFNHRKRIIQHVLPTNIGQINQNDIMIGSEDMVRMDTNSTSNMLNVVYYQDINQSWPFYTSSDRGLPLLAGLVRECSICLVRNKELMLQQNNALELVRKLGTIIIFSS